MSRTNRPETSHHLSHLRPSHFTVSEEATMGRNWKRNQKNKYNRGGKQPKPADPSKYGEHKDPYKLISGGNYKLEAYYACQGIHEQVFDSESEAFLDCQSDEQKEKERIKWLESMKSILPASFRIGRDVDGVLRERLKKELESYVGNKMEIEVIPKGGERRTRELDLKPEVKMIAPAKSITFIPHAYQLNLDRQTIRRNPTLNPFHEWLKVQTEAGFITRQETVSMIPPVVLDPERQHTVLGTIFESPRFYPLNQVLASTSRRHVRSPRIKDVAVA